MPADRHSPHRTNTKVRFAASLSVIVLVFSSLACTANLSNTSIADQGAKTGTDSDGYGCIATAGYTWSQLRKECIRLWEVGMELTNVQDSTATTVGYLITHSERDSIELFLPERTGSILLHKSAGNWIDSKKLYSLSKNGSGAYQLHNNKGILLYQNGEL